MPRGESRRPRITEGVPELGARAGALAMSPREILWNPPPKGHAIALVVVGVVSTRGKVRTKTRCSHYLLCEKELGHLSVPGWMAPTAKMAEKIIRRPRIVVVEEGEDRYTCTV